MWEKRATSAEGKTIRIAESSDMDSWEELLRPCASFTKFWVWKEIEVKIVLGNYTEGVVWCCWKISDQDGAVDKTVIFEEKVLKENSYLFFNKGFIFEKKV